MTTSSRITPTPTHSPPAPPPPAAAASSSAPAAAMSTRPPTTAELVRQILSRVVGAAAARSLLDSGPDAPQTHVVVTALMADLMGRRWTDVAADIEVLTASLGLVMSAADRSALSEAILDRLATATLLDAGPAVVGPPEPRSN